MGFTAFAVAVAGSSILGAYSAVQQGRASAAAGEYNARMGERNAQVAEQQAEQIKRAAEFDVNRFRSNFGDLQATAGTAYRFNGFVASEGTPALQLIANAKEADEEIFTMRYNASINRQQALETATEMRLQARLDRMVGRQAGRAGYIGAAGSLLGGAAQIAGMRAMPTPGSTGG